MGESWLAAPPKVKLLKVTDAAEPYPLSWDEQARLFQQLPKHLAQMSLFKATRAAAGRAPSAHVCRLLEVGCAPDEDTANFVEAFTAGHSSA